MDKLRKVWNVWKRIGQAIGDLIARLVLTVFYFTLMLPFGLCVRFWGDPLRIRREARDLWLDRATRDPRLGDARRLF